LMAHNSTKQDLNIWYLNSSASNHMTGRENLFVKFDEKIQGEISFNDLSNVYYVHGMKTDILSLG